MPDTKKKDVAQVEKRPGQIKLDDTVIKPADTKAVPATGDKKPDTPAKPTDTKAAPAAGNKKPETPAKPADTKAAPAADDKKPDIPAKPVPMTRVMTDRYNVSQVGTQKEGHHAGK